VDDCKELPAMKTVTCLEPGRLDIIDRPVLAGPPKGWARLAVSHVGICGTDYHIFEGKHPYLEYPRVMGHEISARVIEAGEGVSLAPAGSRALVIGAGPIGLGTALFSRIAGHEVTLLDASVERLDMAADRLGLARGILAGDGALDAVLAATGGDGFDVVFDATGFGGSMEKSFAFVAHGGCLVFVSVVKDEIRFSDPEFHKREMMLVGSRNATRQDFEHVAASIRAGHVPVESLITHRTTLDEVVNDLPRWAHEKGGLIKAVVKVSP
jgi:threonine dehydrogenase-like Zn-dependent dehydrogenase